MAYTKNLMSDTDDRKLKDIHNAQENEIENEFNSQSNRISGIANSLGIAASRFEMLYQGYNSGDVIDTNLTRTGAIYVLVTGRWISMCIISWDRGSDSLVIKHISTDPRVTVAVSGTRLTVNITANAEYVLYAIK